MASDKKIMERDTWLEPRKDLTEMPKELHRYKQPRLVQVDWVDSTGFSGWRDSEEWKSRDPNHCRTVGYLLSQDREAIHLAPTRDHSGGYNDRFVIPKGCVKVIRELGVKHGYTKTSK